MQEPVAYPDWQCPDGKFDGQAVETERLIVSRHDLPATNACRARTLVGANWKDRGQPEVIAHITYDWGINCIDWLEVNDRFRRQGIATEFKKAVAQMVGFEPDSYAATEAGRMFLKSYFADLI